MERAPNHARALIAYGEALAGLGETNAAVRAARRALELNPREADALIRMMVRYEAIVRVFARTGDTEALLEQLQDYLSSPADWTIDGLRLDPRMRPAFHDPRVNALVAEFGGQQAATTFAQR